MIGDDVLDAIDELRGPRQVEELPGGLTNHNYKVTTAHGRFVVRHSPDDVSALAIDREQEYRNSLAAANSGVGAPVIAYRPDLCVLVVGFLDGVTLTEASFTDPDVVARAARACRRLHDGERFVNDFDMFAIQARYLSIVQRNGYRLPADYLDHAPHVARIKAALPSTPVVPCNNDLLAANFIDDGERIWLIDYEYGGNNDACFELGNVWSECHLDDDRLDELIAGYYGKPLRHKVARAKLQGQMSRYGWTLWASIQDATSTVDFDFWGWGMEKYDAAAQVFGSPEFDRLLDEARRPD